MCCVRFQHRKWPLVIYLSQQQSRESAVASRRQRYDKHSFQKGRDHHDADDGRVCQGENASPWALCVCVCFLWANKLHVGKLGSTCPYCHALTHPHSHTFPLSTQHPILSKDEEKAEPCARQRPPIHIKTVNPLSFLSLSLDMFLKATKAHCVSLPLLSCV